MRKDGRAPEGLRRIEFELGFTTNPWGSVLVRFGKTIVLCTTCVQAGVPKFREGKGGWLTAEYAMAPGSTHSRTPRESMAGRVQGRTQEIQRLVGRSIRAAVDLARLGENTVHLDCEVLQADGGTRTAAITGAFVSLAIACDRLLAEGGVSSSPLVAAIAAVSCGVVGGERMVDLCYEEDVRAEVDMNVVMTGTGDIVEVQATGEGGTLRRADLDGLLDLSAQAIAGLVREQRRVLGPAWERLGLPGEAP